MKLAIALAFALGCNAAAPPRALAPSSLPGPATTAAASKPPLVVRQVKSAHELRAPSHVAAYTVADGAIAIDGRSIPIAGSGPIPAIAHGLARVPPQLRALLHALVISPVPSPNDAVFELKYRMPVQAGMSTAVSGDITIYPYGLAELSDEDFFVKNFMHEFGHAWSLREWRDNPSSARAWRDAIASDSDPPSEYARMSFRNSGALDEDAAEATALYFIELGTPAFETYRARMPARFGIIAARFASQP